MSKFRIIERKFNGTISYIPQIESEDEVSYYASPGENWENLVNVIDRKYGVYMGDTTYLSSYEGAKELIKIYQESYIRYHEYNEDEYEDNNCEEYPEDRL